MNHRHQWFTLVLIVSCFGALILGFHGRAMVGGGQFAYRDAAHYYYPLYQRVQEEWNAGRWPLWEPEENSGMPLLGNPTAAVLYPGKLIYALFPYAWGARLYVVAHTTLAFVAMLVLMRCWKISWPGAALSASSYAFSAPIVFQYCNIIYLVGAAWLPLGFLAVDRWIRGGSRWALLGLSVVLAMQTLGGDPQVSYLLGLCGGGYALGLTLARNRARLDGSRDGTVRESGGRWWYLPLMAVIAILWAVGTVALAEVLPKHRPQGRPTPALPWMPYVSLLVSAGWGIAGLVFLVKWRRGGWRHPLGLMLLGLTGSAVLAAALSAAQLLLVIEFTQQTSRAAGDGPHDIYPFSLEPFRLAELVWPSVFGTHFGRNAFWFDVMRLPGVRPKIWVPSLYLGCFGLILAFSSFTLRRGPATRVWLSVIVLVSLVGSLGEYTSPIWATRILAETTGLPVPDIGPLDTNDVTPIRQDRYLRDGDGSVYWWMTTLLPGFRQFRFPSKLLTFTVFGITALSGMGWDRLQTSRGRGTVCLIILLLGLTGGLATGVLIKRQAILDAFQNARVSSAFGPLDHQRGFAELVRSLGHTGLVLTLSLFVILMVKRRPRLAGSIMLLIVSADLAAANARYVLTVPQALLETEPEVLRIINEAELKTPARGPFRIHRMPLWNPPGWYSIASDDRVRDFLVWERNTIQPKYGINLGVEYTHTIGVAELYDYEFFFGGFPRTIDSRTASALGAQPGQEVVYFPRRSFDMWNTRYFVLPSYPAGWRDEMRGYAAFLHETEPVYPDPARFKGPQGEENLKAWIETSDFQIRRNLQEYPRAWIVHAARGINRIDGLSRADRAGPMQEMLYSRDPIWHDSTSNFFDPRSLVWIDNEDRGELQPFLNGANPQAGETVKVSYPSPRRVELEAKLDNPGIVILSDIYYPGWKLTIDGKPARVYRVNRLMRGAAVPEGTHRLVYSYEPRSFQLGGAISIAGLICSFFFALYSVFRPRVFSLAEPAP